MGQRASRPDTRTSLASKHARDKVQLDGKHSASKDRAPSPAFAIPIDSICAAERSRQLCAPPATPSPFFRLPPELRNQIYELALVLPPRYVCVIPEGRSIREPSLLVTNKQIRNEAAPIFYGQNNFTFHDIRYDPNVIRGLAIARDRIKQQFNVEMFTTMDHYQTPDWPNLKTWLKRLHNDELRLALVPSDGTVSAGSVDRQVHLVRMAFRVVENMAFVPWELVEAVLDDIRVILVSLDLMWQ